jgi:hypothetical protein
VPARRCGDLVALGLAVIGESRQGLLRHRVHRVGCGFAPCAVSAAHGCLVAGPFGEPTRTVFRMLWAEHTDQLVAVAVAAQDQDRRDNAQAALRGLEQRAAGLLGAATTIHHPPTIKPGSPELVQTGIGTGLG